MNSGVQEIRSKRLEERRTRKSESEIKDEAQEMFNFVLDMFQNSTDNNTVDEVFLARDLNTNHIYVGTRLDGSADKKYDPDVIKQFVKMIDEEGRYLCDHDNDYTYVVIETK